ncbi:hypothetical protein SDC9_210184 [bioreactor metagenome]|uniref:Uncharacterized protein n=1 Tax=bioreactor metagenome TaxID=1076179 RepID=A0A645JG55_9ZZZZ
MQDGLLDFVGVGAHTAAEHIACTRNLCDALGNEPSGTAFRCRNAQMFFLERLYDCCLQIRHIYSINKLSQFILDLRNHRRDQLFTFLRRIACRCNT